MRTADNLPHPPNPAEIALLCDLAPNGDEHGSMFQDDDFTYSGMKSMRKSRQMNTERYS